MIWSSKSTILKQIWNLTTNFNPSHSIKACKRDGSEPRWIHNIKNLLKATATALWWKVIRLKRAFQRTNQAQNYQRLLSMWCQEVWWEAWTNFRNLNSKCLNPWTQLGTLALIWLLRRSWWTRPKIKSCQGHSYKFNKMRILTRPMRRMKFIFMTNKKENSAAWPWINT